MMPADCNQQQIQITSNSADEMIAILQN
uniref:Uncharacterized protein n=1 Tax=Arundo donax TaxID=35708 RepID=A0A0A9BCN7_ARUDO